MKEGWLSSGVLWFGLSSVRGCWCWSDAHVSMASSLGGSGEIGCSLGAAHEAADDPDRSEPWADMLEGKRMKAAEESLNELSHALDRELTEIEK